MERSVSFFFGSSANSLGAKMKANGQKTGRQVSRHGSEFECMVKLCIVSRMTTLRGLQVADRIAAKYPLVKKRWPLVANGIEANCSVRLVVGQLEDRILNIHPNDNKPLCLPGAIGSKSCALSIQPAYCCPSGCKVWDVMQMIS